MEDSAPQHGSAGASDSVRGVSRAALSNVHLCFTELFEGRAEEAHRNFAPDVVEAALELLRASAACGASEDGEDEQSRRSLDAGTRINSFTILAFLGSGATGEVYRAMQANPTREVALKVYWPEVGSAAKSRIFREANTLAGLEHPSIARLYQAGEASVQGVARAWIAMEYVRGVGTLHEWSKQTQKIEDRVRMGIKIAEAVAHAHGRGVIHCDLKPGNILVDEGDRPVLIDFGLARVEQADALQSISLLGPRISGTLAYIAPEMLESGARADVRADIFAIGAILYELLGARPFRKFGSQKLGAMLREASHGGAPMLGSVDRALRGDLERIVAKATATQPAERHASASELAEDLRRHLAGEPVLTQLQSKRERVVRALWRNRRAVAVAAAIALLLLATTAVSLMFARDAQRSARLANLNAAARAIDARDLLLLNAHLAALGPDDATIERALLERAATSGALHIADGGWYGVVRPDSSWILAEGFPRPFDSELTLARFDRDGSGEYTQRWRNETIKGSMRTIVVNAAKTRILSFGKDWVLQVIDAERGDVIAMVPPNGIAPDSCALAISRSDMVAVALTNITLRAFDRLDQVRATIDAGIGVVYAMAFSPVDPQLLLAVGQRGAVMIDCTNAVVLTRFEVPESIQSAAAWSLDGAHALVAGWDRTLRAYNPREAKPVWTAHGHTDSVWDIAAVDSTRIATVAADGTLRLWRAANGAPIGAVPVSNDIAWTLAIDHATGVLDLGLHAGLVELELSDLNRWIGIEGCDPLESFAVGVSARPHGPGMVEITRGGISSVIAIPGSGTTERIALSADGTALAALRSDGTISLTDLGGASSEARTRWSTTALKDGDVHESNGIPSMAVAPRGSVVYVASRNNGCVALDGAIGNELWCRPIGRSCTDVAVAPDGAIVFASDRDGLLERLDARNGSLLASVRRQRTRVSCMTVTADGTRLVTGGSDGSLRILDASSLEELVRLSLSPEPLRAVRVDERGVWATDRLGVMRGR